MGVAENPYGEEQPNATESNRQRKKRIAREIFLQAEAEFAALGLDVEQYHRMLLRVGVVKSRRYVHKPSADSPHKG